MKIENWKLLFISIFYIVFAIICYMVPKEKFLNFFYIAGLIIAVVGFLQIVMYFLKKDYLKPNTYGFSFGVLYGTVGIILASRPEFIVDNYPIVISAVIVLDSTLRMQYAMNLFRLDNKHWIVHFILSIIPWIIGLFVILYPIQDEILQNVFIFLLLLDAIANIYTVIYYHNFVKQFGYYGNEILDISSMNQEE